MISGWPFSSCGVPSNTISPLTRITTRSATRRDLGHALVDQQRGDAGVRGRGARCSRSRRG